MQPYLIVFFIVYIIACFIEKITKKKSNILSKVLLFIMLLIVSIFAGMRDETVGTDVVVYPKPIINTFKNHSFSVVYNTANVEIGFIIIAWLTKLIQGDLNTFLFFIQVFIFGIYILYAYKNRKDLSFSSLILTFLCMIFGFSLNIMRQTMAIVLTIFSYNYVQKRELKKFLITIFIAINFHITALVFIPVYFIYNYENKKLGVLLKFVILASLIMFLFFFSQILVIAMDIGILPDKYMSYLTRFNQDVIDVQIKAFLLKLFFTFVAFFILNKDKENKKNAKCMNFLLCLDCILFLIGSKISYAERISYYFTFLVYGYVFARGQVIFNKQVFRIFNFGCALLYWFVMFGMLNHSEIIPYTSILLNIN